MINRTQENLILFFEYKGEIVMLKETINKELEQVGEYASLSVGRRGPVTIPKRNTPVTPTENFIRFINNKPYWAPNSADFVTIIPKIIKDNVARGFVFDSVPFNSKEEAGGLDLFGVEWEFIPQVGGSMVRPGNPLKVPDVTKWQQYISFPNLDELDWEGSAAGCKKVADDDRVKIVWVMNGLFERLISFMEFENAALSLVDEDTQESVQSLFDALCNFYDDMFDRYKKYYNASVIYFHDDWGSQRAPFFSESTAREMLLPYLKRVCDSAHKRGMYIDFHSCGKVDSLVPVMIEAGVDIWSGQPMNDRIMVLTTYGDKIKLNLSPDVRMGATPEEMETAQKEYFDTYGPYMGSIIATGSGAGGPGFYEAMYMCSRALLAK
jgi:hypothetical protein